MSSEIHYVTYFDIASTGYRVTQGVTVGIALLLAGLVCIMFRKKINDHALFTISRVRLYAFSTVALIWTGYAAWSSYSNYHSSVHMAKSGQAAVTEGVITDFNPQTSEVRGFTPERFCVQSSCFQYSSMSSKNQFNQSHIMGGPIREGLQVRITSYEGRILKLEIAK